jgi:hypothetical protein
LTRSLVKSKYLSISFGKLNVSELIFLYRCVVLSMVSDVGLESVLEKGGSLCGSNQTCNYDFVLHINYWIFTLKSKVPHFILRIDWFSKAYSQVSSIVLKHYKFYFLHIIN